MTAGEGSVEPPRGASPPERYVPARLLAPWLAEEAAISLLTAAGGMGADEARARIAAARSVVAGRAPYGAGGTAAGAPPAPAPAPAELDGYLEQFWSNATYQVFSPAKGWSVRLVELHRVLAAQDRVYLDRAQLAEAPASLLEVARVTLPEAPPGHKMDVFSGTGGLLLTCPNPNLGIDEPYVGQPVPGGPIVAGVAIRLHPSVVQVVEWGGRLVLRDGYHRVFELLRLGVEVAPALFRAAASPDDVLRQSAGVLPVTAWTGDRPPFVADLLDDAVAIEARLSRMPVKTIAVQWGEFY